MVFFDTCIWIELCCTMVPSNPTQQAQAQKASQLLANVQQQNEQIVTCNEQLIEVISAIQKVKMREYNKISKPGVATFLASIGGMIAGLMVEEQAEDIRANPIKRHIENFDITILYKRLKITYNYAQKSLLVKQNLQLFS